MVKVEIEGVFEDVLADLKKNAQGEGVPLNEYLVKVLVRAAHAGPTH